MKAVLTLLRGPLKWWELLSFGLKLLIQCLKYLDVSQEPSPRVPVSNDLKISDGSDLRTFESDRTAKATVDELSLPDLSLTAVSEAEIVSSLVEETIPDSSDFPVSASVNEATNLKRLGSTHLGEGIAPEQLKISKEPKMTSISKKELKRCHLRKFRTEIPLEKYFFAFLKAVCPKLT